MYTNMCKLALFINPYGNNELTTDMFYYCATNYSTWCG